MSESATLELHCKNRRSRYRHKLRTLSHTKLNSGEFGVLRDVSDNGAALQVLSRLLPEQIIRLQLDLANPRSRLEVDARVVWSDSLGQAGVVFVNIDSRSQRVLKEWLFTQVLSDAHRVIGDHASELLFSAPLRPTIHLQPDLSSGPSSAAPEVHLLWFNIPALRFSRYVDAIALLCAVLLFNLLVLFLTDMSPSWRLTMALVVCVTIAFAAMYWLIFAIWFGVTPGTRLAELASAEGGNWAPAEREIVRFR